MKDYEEKLSKAETACEVCKWCDEQIAYAEAEINSNTLAQTEYIENNPDATVANDWHMECYENVIAKLYAKVTNLRMIIDLITKKF